MYGSRYGNQADYGGYTPCYDVPFYRYSPCKGAGAGAGSRSRSYTGSWELGARKRST